MIEPIDTPAPSTSPARSLRPLFVALLGVALLIVGGLGAGYAEHLHAYEAPWSARTTALGVPAALGVAFAGSRRSGLARALRVALGLGPLVWAIDLHDPAINLTPLGPLLCALGALVIAVDPHAPRRRAHVPAGILLVGLGLQRPLADAAPAYPVYDPFEFVGIHTTLATNHYTAPLYRDQLCLELALVVGSLTLAAVAAASDWPRPVKRER